MATESEGFRTAIDFAAILGKKRDSSDISLLVQAFDLDRVRDAPPERFYLGSKPRGLDLVFEADRLKAVQIYVQSAQGFAAFGGQLPFGLRAGMTQSDVHACLGAPAEFDEWSSIYEFSDNDLSVNVEFDESVLYMLHVRRLN